MKPIITIIGAGLTGLLIAYRLEKLGFQVSIIEARERVGGRIHTVKSSRNTPIEMGATWFGNQHTHLKALLQEFSLPYFEQYMQGTAFFEALSTAPAQAVQIPQDAPSYRVSGGTSTMINTLCAQLQKTKIYLGERLQSLVFEKDKVQVSTQSQTLDTDILISTLPPALLIHTIDISPALPEALREVALQTHTWMQDSTKVALSYSRPFWKEKNYSGTLFSNVGPITEFYDHSDSTETYFALCGFMGGGYAQCSKEERKAKVIAQLVRVFGEEASHYLSYEETIWAEETFTKSKAQENFSVYPHQNNGHEVFSKSYFNQRLWLAGTETSSTCPGYMEGAICSAIHVVERIKTQALNSV